jgi:hypothetical protein
VRVLLMLRRTPADDVSADHISDARANDCATNALALVTCEQLAHMACWCASRRHAARVTRRGGRRFSRGGIDRDTLGVKTMSDVLKRL